MNLGDGLLFELENGKPKLILLSRGVEKNPAKLSFGPRKANVLSSRRPSCVGEARGDEERPGRQRQAGSKSKAGGAAAPFTSTTGGGRSTAVTSSKTQQRHRGHNVHAVAEAKSDRHKDDTAVGSLRADGKKGRPQRGGTFAPGSEGVTGSLASGGTGPKDTEGCLTDGQLQKILLSVQTSSVGPHPPEEHRTRANQSDPKEGGSLIIDGGEMKEEDRGGGTETSGRSLDKDDRSSACAFSWQEERHSDSRAAADAKKALWRRELDEQVALKQQRSAPGRLQAEFSVQSSISHRDQPAAIRSSLRLGEVTPMEEEQSAERRREQRRRWLEELDQQREETSQRRRQEKLLQRQTEDHELWARHFDSLKRRPPAPSSPPPSTVSERGEWEPSSSLSLVWEATSSCGAESVGRASVDTTSAHPTRARYLRSMTALLDPAQIEERDRRRLKQLEQQRAIEAQVEERRVQREREEARRREELEEEERRVALEREALERQFALDTLRQKSSAPAQQPDTEDEDNERPPKTLETSVSRQSDSLEDNDSSSSPCRDTAVQTVPSLPLRVQTPEVSAHYQTPPPPPSAAPPNVRNRVVRTGKENICLPAARGGGGRGRGGGGGGGGGRGRGGDADPYEVFARTDGNERRPEWNTQRPSRRFVPASERYPPPLQRNRQESRQRRQAELLALQDRTCLSRTDPPNPPPPSPHQEPRLCSNPPQTRTGPPVRVQNVSRGQSVLAAINAERGRSPPRAGDGDQRQRAPSSSPPPPLEFVPYMRSDEVFHMDPLEPADTPPPPTRSEAPLSSVSPPVPSHRRLHTEPPRKTHTHRQQEILRGLAQLRQGLLQKQRELETELNPLSKRHGNEHRK